MLKRIARRILLNPTIRAPLSKIVEFYNNQPVFSSDAPVPATNKTPMFHIGNAMPFNDNDCSALHKVAIMASKLPNNTIDRIKIVEVGSWTGRSTVALASVAKTHNGVVFAVDHWQGNTDVWQYGVAKQYDILAIFRQNMVTMGVADVVYPIVSDSIAAASVFADESLDLVFIDADHRYTPFKKDLLAWLPKVKRGGIISGHDCSGYYSKLSDKQQAMVDKCCEIDDIPGIGHPGVIKALHELFNDTHEIMPNSVIWYKEV